MVENFLRPGFGSPVGKMGILLAIPQGCASQLGPLREIESDRFRFGPLNHMMMLTAGWRVV